MTADPNVLDFDALAVLIDCMEATPPLSNEEVSRLHRTHAELIFPAMLDEGKTYGEASGGALNFLNRPDAEDYVKSIRHDLAVNVGIVSDSFRDYLTSGEIPAPGYAWRVCIILKKLKRRDIELRFLRSWARHFANRGVGMTYLKLATRHSKLETATKLEM